MKSIASSMTEKIRKMALENIIIDQTNLINQAFISDIKLGELINIDYYMFDGMEYTENQKSDKLIELEEDIVELEILTMDFKDKIENETNSEELNILHQLLSQRENELDTLVKERYELNKSDLNTYIVKRWILVTHWLGKQLKNQHEICLESQEGFWWGVKESSIKNLEDEVVFAKIMTSLTNNN